MRASGLDSGANLSPLLPIGVPGNLTTAVLIGAFLVQGVQPGPLIFHDHGRLIYGIFTALALANVFNFINGFALTPHTELYIRQTVILYSDHLLDLLLHHPIALFFMTLTVYSTVRIALYQNRQAKRKRAA